MYVINFFYFITENWLEGLVEKRNLKELFKAF